MKPAHYVALTFLFISATASLVTILEYCEHHNCPVCGLHIGTCVHGS